jgi:hypothetical protein
MARRQTDKKLISFLKLSLIDKLVKDEAELMNRSESAIIENHLLNSFLPEERNARFWAENILYCEDNAIGQTLNAIFGSNAAGINWNSVHDNLLPLVKFAHKEGCLCNTVPTGKEEELYHFRSQLDSVIQKLETLADERPEKRFFYLKESEWAKLLLKGFQESPQNCKYTNIYQLLLNNWEDLKS